MPLLRSSPSSFHTLNEESAADSQQCCSSSLCFAHSYLIRNQINGVEADAELADQRQVAALVADMASTKFVVPDGHGAEVRDEVGLGHPHPVADRQRARVLVEGDADLELLLRVKAVLSRTLTGSCRARPTRWK